MEQPRPAPPEPARPPDGASIALGAALVVAVLAVFAQVRTFGFVNFDDPLYVTGNGVVKEGLTLGGVRWAFTGFNAANWHPVTWLSHMLDVELFGLDPGAHHLVAVALHAVATLLLFAFLRRATGARWRSALVAALFAIHPLHVESVAWVSERKDVLSTLFAFAALHAYVGWVRRPTPGRYVVVAALLALGLMSKPMVVSLPILLLLVDVWPLGRWVPGRDPARAAWPLVREKLPLAALSAASAVVTVLAQERAVAAAESIPFAARLGNAALSYALYLGDTVWPAGLAAFYPHPALTPAGLSPGAVALAALLLAGLTALAGWQLRRRPFVAVGWAWYLVSLLPVIGLVQAGTQGRADRYTYLPLVGVFVALAWALPGAAEGAGRGAALRRASSFAGGGAVLAAALVSHAQAAHWRDTPAVWQRAIAVTDDNALAWGNLGVHHLTSGDAAGAVAALEQAVRIDPGAASHWVDLGAAYRASGRLGEARDAFVRATQLAPRHRDAAFQLGVTLLSAGDPFAAVAALERTVEIDPRHAGAWAALAVANATIGDPSRARAAAEQVRGLAPGLAAEVDAQLAAMGLGR